MATNRQILIRAFVRAAKLQVAQAGSGTIKSVLETIVLGKFQTEVTDGKTLVSTSEAGGSVTFALPNNLGPAEIMALAEEAIEWLDNQPDPDNPNLSPRPIRRLRVSFAKTTI